MYDYLTFATGDEGQSVNPEFRTQSEHPGNPDTGCNHHLYVKLHSLQFVYFTVVVCFMWGVGFERGLPFLPYPVTVLIHASTL